MSQICDKNQKFPTESPIKTLPNAIDTNTHIKQMCLFFYSQRQSVNSIVTSMSECELLHIYFCFFCHFIFGWQIVAGKTWWEQKIKKPENRLQKNETHKKPTWNLSLMHTNININIIYAYVWYEMAHRLDNDNEPLLLLLLTLSLFFFVSSNVDNHFPFP